MTGAAHTPGKSSIFRELLADGIVSLHLDPRVAGVQVPPQFRRQEWLVLNFSYSYHIGDFRFDDNLVEATLSFAGQPYPCRVPWQAVFAVTDTTRTRGHAWHDDVPPEVLLAQEQAARQTAARLRKARASVEPVPARSDGPQSSPEAARGSGPPRLQVLSGGQDERTPARPSSTPPAEPGSDGHDTSDGKPRPGGHLRRVK